MTKNFVMIMGLFGTVIVATGDYWYLFFLPIVVAFLIIKWGQL